MMRYGVMGIVLVMIYLLSLYVLSEKVIYHARNDFGDVYVVGNNFYRCIKTDLATDVVQSCYDVWNKKNSTAYVDVLARSITMTPQLPRHILVLGLGGGSIVQLLRMRLPDAHIDAVDINPLMVDIAQKYFDLPTNNIDVYVEDGYRFIMQGSAYKYDVVIIDVYANNLIPEDFLRDVFVKHLMRAMTPLGIVAINIHKYHTEQHVEAVYKRYLSYVTDVVLGTNTVVFFQNA